MTDDNLADVQQPSDLPTITVAAIRNQIHALVLSLEHVKVVEGTTGALELARRSAHATFGYIEAHAAAVVRKADQDIMDSMFGDAETAVIARAAASPG
jgi:hypothetical protein